MPRKKLTVCIISITLLCSAFSVNSSAGQDINVLMNGTPVAFDVPPQNIGGRVMVPFRAIGESIGALVDWNADTQSVWMYSGGQYIGLTIGETTVRIGKMGGPEISIDLDVAPQIVGGRTLVPVRAVAEGLKADVKWDAPSNTVIITTSQTVSPTVDSKEKLLAFIDGNISDLNTKFYVNTVNLSPDTIGLNVCDYFLNVLQAHTTSWKYTADGTNYTYIEYDITYSMYSYVSRAIKTGSTTTLTPAEKQVYDKVELIVAENVNPDMTDYEKELALHDYLVLNTAYDPSPPDELPWDSHTPYGALINGVAVCNGYSDSFKLLMDAVGIECDIVYGEAAVNGVSQAHAWNRVMIDGDYYLVDVTWDDAFPDKPDVVTYDYFNVTDDMIRADHTPYTDEHECTADRYNYFVYNKLCVYDQSDIDNIIKSSLASGARHIYMRGVRFDISRMSFQAFAAYLQSNPNIEYSVNPRMNVIRIFLE